MDNIKKAKGPSHEDHGKMMRTHGTGNRHLGKKGHQGSMLHETEHHARMNHEIINDAGLR